MAAQLDDSRLLDFITTSTSFPSLPNCSFIAVADPAVVAVASVVAFADVASGNAVDFHEHFVSIGEEWNEWPQSLVLVPVLALALPFQDTRLPVPRIILHNFHNRWQSRVVPIPSVQLVPPDNISETLASPRVVVDHH
jgi:hypothetical protein